MAPVVFTHSEARTKREKLLITRRIAHHVPEGARARVQRGIKLYREHGEEIEHMRHGVYSVPGCSGGTYRVDLAPFGGAESCNCRTAPRYASTSWRPLFTALRAAPPLAGPSSRSSRPTW